MKKMVRNINRFDDWSNSWFTDEVTEYEIATKIYQWIAKKLPKRLIYFCYIRFMSFASTHGSGCKKSPNDICFDEAVDIWESHNH
jgi:hypothetical protein